MSFYKILGNYERFLKDSLQEIEKLGISINGYDIDHICFRVSSVQEYDNYKKKLMKKCSAYLENFIHGRPISKFILKIPLKVNSYTISVIELPSPKENHQYKTGLEHFEIAVGNDFNNFKNKYKKFFSGEEDMTSLNNTVYITLKNNKTVKFHKFPLTKVVELEGFSFVKI